MPPYLPLWQVVDDAGDRIARLSLDLSSYLRLFADSLYVRAYLNSLRIAAIATVLALLVGLPDRLRDGRGAGALARRRC